MRNDAHLILGTLLGHLGTAPVFLLPPILYFLLPSPQLDYRKINAHRCAFNL